MKATLEFDLNDRDDAMAHKRCVKATDMAIAIFEILYNTRPKIELEIENGTHEPYEVLQAVMNKIEKDLAESKIDIDELID